MSFSQNARVKQYVINVMQPKNSRQKIRDQFYVDKAHVKQYVINVMQPKHSRQKYVINFMQTKLT